MEKGTYTGRRVDFGRYATAVFNPFLFSCDIRGNRGCGATTLALLTGVSPDRIARLNHYQPHFADEFIVGFLRRRGFTVLPLTQCNVSASDSQLSASHVVLLSQLFRKNEATWGVIFDGIYYHNFDIYTLDSMSFLSKPILSAYLISSPLWRLDQLPRPNPTPAPKAKLGKLTLRDLVRKGLVSKVMSRTA
ncbi:MAG TPA: hypothetical protein VGY56_07700 [Verrucomicrobiae bacterium]|nr:hypothetical protein [Verrucomicrobiae bacterium]